MPADSRPAGLDGLLAHLVDALPPLDCCALPDGDDWGKHEPDCSVAGAALRMNARREQKETSRG